MAMDVSRTAVVSRARWLNRATIGWNAVEAGVAIAAGVVAGSASLLGFGLDAVVEVSAALVLTWRLSVDEHEDRRAEHDRRATRLIGAAFLALAAWVAFDAIRDLVTASVPDVSVPGIVIAALSLAVMPWLATQKARTATALDSRAAGAEARQTWLCTYLSAALLAGLVANAWLGWWWADPVAALVIAGVAANEGREHLEAETLEDSCTC